MLYCIRFRPLGCSRLSTKNIRFTAHECGLNLTPWWLWGSLLVYIFTVVLRNFCIREEPKFDGSFVSFLNRIFWYQHPDLDGLLRLGDQGHGRPQGPGQAELQTGTDEFQHFGSGFMDSGSGSCILGWIPVGTDPGLEFWWPKILKNFTADKTIWCFFDQKLQFTCP